MKIVAYLKLSWGTVIHIRLIALTQDDSFAAEVMSKSNGYSCERAQRVESAGGQGFGPRLKASKASVLPLDDPPKIITNTQ